MLDHLYDCYPQVKGKVDYVDLGTPLDNDYYLGRFKGDSYGILTTPAKVKAEREWIRPIITQFPKGLYCCGQDITSDGFAPAVLSGLMVCSAVYGPHFWVACMPDMLGGLISAISVL